MREAADDYSSRAEALRRLADGLENARERSALIAIADQYEAVAARLMDDDCDPEADQP